jgi:hypothetical protein
MRESLQTINLIFIPREPADKLGMANPDMAWVEAMRKLLRWLAMGSLGHRHHCCTIGALEAQK